MTATSAVSKELLYFPSTLLNTESFQLTDFNERDIPQYAILSHTWEEEEILYRDLANSQESWADKRGAGKLKGFCKTAAENGYEWVWDDTTNIDWYRKSHACYVSLADVSLDSELWFDQFKRSRWFKRGWTLQELLAPEELEFYDKDWRALGTKSDLSEAISLVSGIPIVVLTHQRSMFSYTVEDRMVWAADRTTTRIEDIAYCLLGMFQMNMPLLYGEGKRAFRRLQEQLFTTTGDFTILGWGSSEASSRRNHPKISPLLRAIASSIQRMTGHTRA
ncbi:hypothetical protein BT63DRAFT_430993 [Microthyrium microscopicum]|uniref:HET-domain-containing protein n=1 Tax=Microthyrium microscopicum TaxID=703497 RepID=A0A6A6URH9_9PEZI|nr:hypothetical protein BT63DRAFT_430993 [Microthyrium microscopicum]